MSRFLDLHNSISGLATAAPGIVAHPEVAKVTEEGLVRAAVACLVDRDADSGRRCFSHRGMTIMKRLERVLEANAGRSLYMTELCAKVGASARMLRWQCQEQLGMAPQRYLLLRRMNLVRRALVLADPTATTVTTIANDYGFGELGRFAAKYRELFGEAPSATLLRSADSGRPAIGHREPKLSLSA